MRVRIMTAALAALGIAGLAAVPAEARDGYRGDYARYESDAYIREIKARIHRQKNRIHRLWDDGLVGHRDRRGLKSHVHYIHDELRYACNDDIVTRHERDRLHAMLDRNSQRIASYRFGGHRGGYGQGRTSLKDDGYRYGGYDGRAQDYGRSYRSGY